MVFGPPVPPARAHSTASSVGSCSSTQQRGRERQSGTSGGSARSALGQHTLPMEAELERDWAYLCQTFTEKGEEKQYTELSAPPLLPLISPVEDEGDVEQVLEAGLVIAATSPLDLPEVRTNMEQCSCSDGRMACLLSCAGRIQR